MIMNNNNERIISLMDNYTRGFFHALIFVIGGFSFIVVFIMFSFGDSIDLFIEKSVVPVATLIAALIGPMMAFRLERNRRLKEDKEQKKACAQEVLFDLLEQYNYVCKYKCERIEPCLEKSKGDEWTMAILLQPHKKLNYMDCALDFKKVSFILDRKPELLQRLSLCSKKYQQLQDIIEERNEVAKVAIYELPDQGSRLDGNEYLSFFRKNISEHTFQNLKEVTGHLVEGVDSYLMYNEETEKLLFELLNETFPETGFIERAGRCICEKKHPTHL